ncbi:RidA family protein [Cupriavidus necator]|uniref:RidA family protein n=1 Tax=Cupriavidus necator TaxID=106590 RepID=UPI0005B47CDE|nr:RidA family protein [Cupriavidus necator]
MRRHIQKALILAMALCAGASAFGADDVIRYKLPNSSFPISQAVEIPAGLTTVYLSGQVPPLQDASQPKDSPLAYGGDTKGQTIGVLKAIEKTLAGMGLGMGDVVKMQVYLVADPAKDNKMDFSGFMEGYTQFFGTSAQPKLPARSAFQIAALANPAYLVEIEVVAARKK